jgi:predicted RNase H-like HicB family nuclease
MKMAYPIRMSKGETHIIVYVPDFDNGTQGTDYADALEMARDVIGLMGITMEDRNEPLPAPSDINTIKPEQDGDVISLVDVDFTEYRRRNDRRAVRRNITLPAWLDAAAAKANINVSRVAQTALKEQLQIAE